MELIRVKDLCEVQGINPIKSLSVSDIAISYLSYQYALVATNYLFVCFAFGFVVVAFIFTFLELM